MGIVCGTHKKPPEIPPEHNPVETQGDLVPDETPEIVAKKRLFCRQWSGVVEASDVFDISSKWMSATSKISISSEYELRDVLGSGCTSKVYKASSKSNPSQLFAVKRQDRHPRGSKEDRYFKSEQDILKELDHCNIVRFFESYQDQEYNYLVLEYCSGPSLVELVESYKGLPADLARKYFYQAVYAVHYIHHAGIAHRDLKLDNFLLRSNDKSADIKLIDFGFARNFKRFELCTMLGTPWYVAPEVFARSRKYGPECDNWSLGIILHMMVFRRAPFVGRSNSGIISSILKHEIDITAEPYSQADPLVIDILKGLLVKDPSKRMGLSTVLQSPWFNSEIQELHKDWTPELIRSLVEQLQYSEKKQTFKCEVFRILVKLADDTPEVQQLKRYFQCFDILSNGVITAVELRHSINEGRMMTLLTNEQVQKIIDSLYLKTDGVVTLSEFIAGSLPAAFLLNRARLQAVFDKFDVTKTGKVTAQHMQKCFERYGYSLTPALAQSVMQEFDTHQDGAVSFQEFWAAMTGSTLKKHGQLQVGQSNSISD